MTQETFTIGVKTWEPPTQYTGASLWLHRNFDVLLSEFGIRVASLLGEMHRGIYHMDNSSLSKANWVHPSIIEITVYDTFATTDSDMLTALVFLCHEYHIRCEIKGIGPHYIRLMFSDRTRDGDTYNSHPTIEQAIETFNKNRTQPKESETAI